MDCGVSPVWGMSQNRAKSGPEVIKLFFMLNSAEYEIFDTHMFKNIKKLSIFSASDEPRMIYFLLLTYKKPHLWALLVF